MQQILVPCPRCQKVAPGPFGHTCPDCGFTIDDLSGQSTEPWIIKKDQQHRELLTSGTVSLFKKQYNASFTHNGVAMLPDLVRFGITYGSRTTITSMHGGHPTDIILAFVPEVIGSGMSIFQAGLVPCSGVMMMSPGSMNHGHSFPTLQQYVASAFGALKDKCKECGDPTDFGQPFCGVCYARYKLDWTKLI